MKLMFTLWELLIKGIPEGFLDVLGVYFLTKTKIKPKQYIITSCFFILINFIIKNLLSLGVSTMISFLILVIFLVLYNRIEITKTIKATLLVVLTVFACESVNLLILKEMYGDKFYDFVGLQKAISGIPSTLFLIIIITIYYLINKNIMKNKKDKDGEVSAKNNK